MLIKGIALLSALAALAICALAGGFSSLGWLWLLPVGFLGTFLVLALIAFLFLLILCARVNMDVPQEEDDPFYRRVTNLYAEAITQILFMRIESKGLEQLPKSGRFLLVCNHLHILDPVLLLAKLPHAQLAFISKWENSSMFVVGKLMHKILCQMINRENDREALKTILKCIKIIKEDKASICVFPEGYTSLDGKLHRFRSGVFKIAQKANVPIVVCTIQNTQNVFHNISRLRPTKVRFHLVAVIPPEELKGVTAVEVGERVHTLMAEDLGPELVAAE